MATFFSTFVILQLFLLPNLPSIIFARTVRPATKPLGFSINLVHRDSPPSPLYDPSSTPAQRAEQAALRSKLRSRRLASGFANGDSMISSTVRPGRGEYLMQLMIGTPPQSYWAVLDTGSDLVWAMCLPCDPCFGKTPSMLDPLQSSTYKSQSCTTDHCSELAAFDNSGCDENHLCAFNYSYADQSSVNGTLSSETLWFEGGAAGALISIQAITFGCVHSENATNPILLEVPALVGLGFGPLSLANQIGSVIHDNKFAYCLPPYNEGNKSVGQLKFGEDAEYCGSGKVQHTPMARGGVQGTYYMLTLEGISVGNNRVNIQPGSAQSIVIDSGTPVTLLAKDIYDQVKDAVVNAMYCKRVSPIELENQLCYSAENGVAEGLLEMTFHFDGADWKLPTSNLFGFYGEGVHCLHIQAQEDGEKPIFGNIAQQNMHVKYDLENYMLSFAAPDAECAN